MGRIRYLLWMMFGMYLCGVVFGTYKIYEGYSSYANVYSGIDPLAPLWLVYGVYGLMAVLVGILVWFLCGLKTLGGKG